MAKFWPAVTLAAILALLLGPAAPAFAAFPLALPGTADQQVEHMVTGPSGATYVVGTFSGAITFVDTGYPSAGLTDAFVAKVNEQGDLVWLKTAGGASVDRGLAIAIDPAENVYVSGVFHDDATFGGGLGSPNLDEFNDGYGDVFVFKLASHNGDVAWAAKASGAGLDQANGLAFLAGDANALPPVPDRVAVGGSFQCGLEFFDAGDPLVSATVDALGESSGCQGEADGRTLPFVAALAANGKWQWAMSDVRTMRQGPADPVGATLEGLISDSEGRLYGFGHTRSHTEFGVHNTIFNPGFPGPPPPLYPLEVIPFLANPIFRVVSLGTSSVNHAAHVEFTDQTLRQNAFLGFALSSLPAGNVPVEVEWRQAYRTRDPLERPEATLCPDHITISSGVRQSTGLTLATVTDFDEGNPEGVLNQPDLGFPNPAFCGTNPSWPNLDTVRFTIPGGYSGTPYIRWEISADQDLRVWIDDIKIKVDGQVIYDISYTGSGTDSPFESDFVARVADEGTGWEWVVPPLIPTYEPRDMAVDPDGNIVVAGDAPSLVPGFSGVFIAEMDSDANWQWVKSTLGGTAQGVFVDDAGNNYLTGSFESTFQALPGDDAILTSEGGSDIFIARLDDVGNWYTGDNWGVSATRQAGGTAEDRAYAVSGDGEGELYLGGDFGGLSLFGTTENGVLDALDGQDAVVANLDTRGIWASLSVEEWVVGVPITPPFGAELSEDAFVPEFFVAGNAFEGLENYFKWAFPTANGGTAQLIPIREIPGSPVVEIRWRVAGQPLESPQRIATTGKSSWPSQRCSDGQTTGCFQIHIAGAPVEILPPPGAPTRAYLQLAAPDESTASVTGGNTFNSATTGFSTLVYVEASAPDPTAAPLDVRVVRTVHIDDPTPDGGAPHIERGVACTIGTEILPPTFHNDPGRTGWMVNELAFYDGSGSQRALNREARTGQIVPVNRVSSSRPQDIGREMVVGWYSRNDLDVAWPSKAIEYDCQWPSDPRRIVVASEQGSEVNGQPTLDPDLLAQLHLYDQADPTLPGFNPNDEHALFASSNLGTGVQALFALRADFGGTLWPDDASDPYAIVKYFDNPTQRWHHAVYRVDATGLGFDSFTFSGFAGRTVNPPYPVRLQDPCAETRVIGEIENADQPPIPFYRDTNSQLWARAEGTGSVKYHYPLQPGWFYDLDGDDLMDDLDGDGDPSNGVGQCIPWMARLPVGAGGTLDPTDPILVDYAISWPSDVPLLTVGETLLEPKRGLPDIFNQAAVEVVFDEVREANPLDPSQTLTQLIDPTGPRYVDLESLPTGTAALATSLDDKGQTIITGNAAGDLRLPYAIYSRLRWDPLTQRLSFAGLYDASGAGDPLLLLNVMTVDERDQLLALSTDSSWQGAVDDLFTLGRNPHGITKVCTADSVVDGLQTCTADRPVDPEQDVLIGVVDTNDDGIHEPYGALGVKAALTAGSAQGTGYVTLAFNDSNTLALPISLEVVRVDCLVTPEPPSAPELISPYIGQINVLAPTNVFDEQVTLRHSGDFGGRVEEVEFEWYRHPDIDGTPPTPPNFSAGSLGGWQQILIPEPQGAVQITVGGANIQTLSDNWYLARYKGLPVCNNATDHTVPAGQPGSTPLDPRAQLSPGWVKRVVAGLNPFDARVAAFHTSPTNTYASMVAQLGERYEGPIAFSDDPNNLNSIGLIEAYETVRRRAAQLSIDSTPPVNYEPANAALLNITSRISDFYSLLANESFADAQDPTIAITTDRLPFNTLAPTIFNFQNQSASLLEEELILLRGRDDRQGPVAAPPVYNRFFWNFTQGDGEVAYALSYNISDRNADGFINESDARLLYPQGHGDAWGHHLTAIKAYYDLLRHPFYSWNPRPEAVPVAGVPLQVDFLDERKFAKSAAARARVGAEIVDLTYRAEYVEDPAGQWQGYKDTDPTRAWGLSGWGRRAGVGAYLDWVVGNSLLPEEDTNPDHVGIQKIDRQTVDELSEITAAYLEIQSRLDDADRGLNPLGLAKGVVPFDLDPARVDAGETHFEQVYGRAVDALNNAVDVWDFSNQLGRMLRFNQDEVADLTTNSKGQERDFRNRLIEVFGRPYGEDVGAGGTYPGGYDGPDLYHYNYVDAPALYGTPFDVDPITGQPDDPEQFGRLRKTSITYGPMGPGLGFFLEEPFDCGTNPFGSGCTLGPDLEASLEVESFSWELPIVSSYAEVKPPHWGERPAAGKIQEALAGVLNAQIAQRQALDEYEKLRRDINISADFLEATFKIKARKIEIANSARQELNALTTAVEVMNVASTSLRRGGKIIGAAFDVSKRCVPNNIVAGVAAGGDVFSSVKCALGGAQNAATLGLDTAAGLVDISSSATAAAKADVSLQSAIETQVQDSFFDLYGAGGIGGMMRREPLLRNEVFARAQMVEQARQRYRNALAEGLRIFEELVVFRKNTAAEVQDYRHQDMTFRIFRNDALQKYRAAFDMAARFTYLAATAYDYDTNLLGTEDNAGRAFLTDIVRQRSLGQLLSGEPVPGSPGLANSLGRMNANFQVLKGQMGFNNPQIETNRFSLREEFLRLSDSIFSDLSWRQNLNRFRVDDLWAVPEFRRLARPFTDESLGPQPGLVIPFTTTVTFGLNFFGHPLSAGDSAYDPSQFSTRARSVGVWFEGYDTLPLSNTPRVYLIPAGVDMLRPPTAGDFTTREWSVVDQLIPVPFAIADDELEDPEWNPLTDAITGSFNEQRRFAAFRAYDAGSGSSFGNQTTTDSRVIGRSVWNTRWLLIIPGGTLLANPNEGMNTFINGSLSNLRGVTDIHIFFKTYAYSGL